MSTQVGFLATLNASNAIFNGTNQNDLALYSLAGQSVWIGCLSNTASNYISVSSNGTTMNGGLTATTVTSPIATHSNVATSNLAVATQLTVANPVIAMTSYASPNPAGAYYVASASTESNATSPAWAAFDNVPATYWQASNALYSATGAYIGANNTQYVSAGVASNVNGEWLQIQMPTGILATSATITCSNISGAATVPVKVVLLGSSDGMNWDFVASNVTPNAATTLTLTPDISASAATTSANYFRLVTASNSIANAPAIISFNIAGTPKPITTTASGAVGIGVDQPVQQLEVAGNMICSGNISAGNLGMFRNRIINGGMMINQRGFSGAIGITAQYTLDRWFADYVLNTTTSITTDSSAPIGLNASIKTVFAFGSIGGSFGGLYQYIEGYNMADFNWGTSYGSPAALSFWINMSITGAMPIIVEYFGSKTTVSYNTSFQINTANTWQYVTIVVPSPPSSAGAFLNTNMTNKYASIGFMHTTAANTSGKVANNTWSTTLSAGNTSALDLAGLSWTRFITGVQLEKGTMATPFEFRPYQIEMQLCQRYYEILFESSISPLPVFTSYSSFTSGNACFGYLYYKTPKRAIPTLSSTLIHSTSTNIILSPTLYLNLLTLPFTYSAAGYFWVNIYPGVAVVAELL